MIPSHWLAPKVGPHEQAARSVASLNTAAALSPPGLRALLVLRAISTSLRVGADAMASFLCAESESDTADRDFSNQFRHLASRARAGVLPPLDALPGLAESPARGRHDGRDGHDELTVAMRESPARLPPVLKAAGVAAALLDLEGEGAHARAAAACALLLCAGGATSDAWIAFAPVRATLPVLAPHKEHDHEGDVRQQAPGSPSARALTEVLEALAREARSMEAGLDSARGHIANDADRIRALGRAAFSALDVHALLSRDLSLTIPEAAHALGQTIPTTSAAVTRLEGLGVAREVTGRKRDRRFIYGPLVDALAPRN